MEDHPVPPGNGVYASLHTACIDHINGATNILRLVEEQKREKEEALIKIRELEKQLLVNKYLQQSENEKTSKTIYGLQRELEAKRKLEQENEKLKRELLLEDMKDKDIAADENTVNKLNMVVAEKQEAIDFLESVNQVLVVKERQSNNELQEARQQLIEGLPQCFSNTGSMKGTIRIKRIGEISMKPFQNACKDRFSVEEAEVKAAELYSLWQEQLKKADWHPLKLVTINGVHQEIVDEDDEMLRKLKDEWGSEISEAVISAYKELNDYNPSGRYEINELWNYKEDRKAELSEVIAYLVNCLKNLKGKRKR